MATEPDYLNLAYEIRTYSHPTDEECVVFHFVDTPGPVVEGWVKAMLAKTKEDWYGWRDQATLEDVYAYRVESASSWIFCNHENRPDHASVTVKDIYIGVEPNRSDPKEAQVTFRRKGWERG
jgi:hypothetical protein